VTGASGGVSAGKGLRRDLASLLILAVLAWWAPTWAAHWARALLLDFGPNDSEYVSGFRPYWEQDGATRYHWTTKSAEVRLPVGLRGSGFTLRLRCWRQFIEPTQVTLTSNGRTLGRFQLQRDPTGEHRIIGLPLPPLEGEVPFVVTIDAPSENARPLGIALDWMEIERSPELGAFVLDPEMRWALLLVALLAYLAPRLAGLEVAPALLHACAWVVAGVAGTAWDVLATQRVATLGLPLLSCAVVAALVLVRWPRSAAALGLDRPSIGGVLLLVVFVAVAIRLALVLHPQFFYPDVKVHAMFAWQLAKDGLPSFLRDFTVYQYRYSLGLQLEFGHWYAFPYPPAFYILCWPLLKVWHYHPQTAVAVLPAVVNGLEALLVFAIARRLGAGAVTALAAAALLPLLPIFLARLMLAYFPALVGHAVDTAVILYLLSRIPELHRPRVVLWLGGLVALALLTYTQSLLNFGILLPLFLVVQIAGDRSAGAWRRHAGLAAAGLLGASLSLAVFYARYVPIFLDMQRGVPMAEEQVLSERADDRNERRERAPNKEFDRYVGPDVNLGRGLRKAAARLWIFYRGFAPLLVVGVVLVARRAPSSAHSRFVAVWAVSYLILNLASGGLPGPNLVRYNKDIEIVAPLCCIGLATLGAWLWERGAAGRLAAIAGGLSFAAFGALRAVTYLTETFGIER